MIVEIKISMVWVDNFVARRKQIVALGTVDAATVAVIGMANPHRNWLTNSAKYSVIPHSHRNWSQIESKEFHLFSSPGCIVAGCKKEWLFGIVCFF